MSGPISIDDTKNWQIFRQKLNDAFAAAAFDPDAPYTWNAQQMFDAGALIKGRTTSVPAGYVGEILSVTLLIGAALSVTNNTPLDILSLSLTAGVWDVSAGIWFTSASATSTEVHGWLSTTSATQPTPPNNGGYTRIDNALIAGQQCGLPVGPMEVITSGGLPVYLSGKVNFPSGSVTGYGFIRAERVA